MRSVVHVLVLLAASHVHAQLTPQVVTPGSRVVSADRLLDVRTGRVLGPVSVLIEDGRIKQVLTGENAMHVTTDIPRHDLGDMTLVPGLIDMHVHLDSDPEYGGYTSLQFGDRFWSVLQVPHAERTLMAGFTTVGAVWPCEIVMAELARAAASWSLCRLRA